LDHVATRRHWLRLAGGLLAAPGLVARSRADGPSAIAWRTDFESAIAEARTSGRPAWVQFTAKWCGYCHKMEREVFGLPDVAALAAGRFVPVKIDADRRADLIERFAIDGLPSTILLAPDGRELGRRSGFVEAPAFLAFLEAAAPAPLALEGYCPVTMTRTGRLVPGRADLSVRHSGSTYRFADPSALASFRARPAEYLPLDGGLCPVSRVDRGLTRPGTLAFGVVESGRIILLADADARARFARDPGRYAPSAFVDAGRVRR